MVVENRQGEFKNSIGNVEARELICTTTHGHEPKRGNAGERQCAEWRGIKGRKWVTVIASSIRFFKKKI